MMKSSIKKITFLGLGLILLISVNIGEAALVTVSNSDGHVTEYTSIQTAVKHANSGDTILVYPGKYVENVFVNKKLTIVSESSNPNETIIEAKNPEDSVFHVISNEVNISGFTISGCSDGSSTDTAGIYLNGVQKNILINNILIDNVNGIFLSGSYNNNISNNKFYNSHYSIHLDDSNRNTLTNNTASCRVLIWSSDENKVSNNICFNVGDYGILLYFSNKNTLKNNEVVSSGSGVYIDHSEGNSLIENVIKSNNEYGLTLDHSSSNFVRRNEVSYNEKGIEIRNCGNNIISENNISCNQRGVSIKDSSSNNYFFSNCFINNSILCNLLNVWNTPKIVAYFYRGDLYNNFIGNYYSEYTGFDVDGNGIGDSPYESYDYYPLVDLPVKYEVVEVSIPVADFSTDRNSGNIPLEIKFTDLSLYNPVSWEWNFGDGNKSNEQNPIHIYSTPGEFNVSLTVGNPNGNNTKVMNHSIFVYWIPWNHPNSDGGRYITTKEIKEVFHCWLKNELTPYTYYI